MPLISSDFSDFVNLLREAVATHGHWKFERVIEKFKDRGHMLNDHPDFYELCDSSAYFIYVFELLECWIDSRENPEAYPSVSSADWAQTAKSLLEDMDLDRQPTDVRWNFIHTESCMACGVHTTLSDGKFVCPKCNREVAFGSG